MMNLDINNIKVAYEFSSPYPLIIYTNLFNDVQLDEIQNSLSKKNTNFDKNVMGNRNTILKGSQNFDHFIKENAIANEINDFFDDSLNFNFFYKNLNNLNIKNLKYFDFYNKNFRFLRDYISRKKNFSFKIKNKLLKTLSSVVNDCKVYCDLDFSVAGSGYEREPHHDNDDRILNFLLYINDFDGKNGGNFQIFKYKAEPKLFDKQPLLKNLEMINKIEPKKGFLVTFLSTPNSIHGVDTILNTNDKRYFFYGSYTSIKKINWKIK